MSTAVNNLANLYQPPVIYSSPEHPIDPGVELHFKDPVNKFLPFVKLHPVKLEVKFDEVSLEHDGFEWGHVLSDCPGFVVIQPNREYHLGFSASEFIIRGETPDGLSVRQLSEAIFRLKSDKFGQQKVTEVKLYLEERTNYLVFVIEFGYDDEEQQEDSVSEDEDEGRSSVTSDDYGTDFESYDF